MTFYVEITKELHHCKPRNAFWILNNKQMKIADSVFYFYYFSMPTISKLAVWRVSKCHASPTSWATSVWTQMAQFNGNSIFVITSCFLTSVVRKSCPLIPELLPFWCILWLQWQLGGNCSAQICSSSNTSIGYHLGRAAMETPVEFPRILLDERCSIHGNSHFGKTNQTSATS